MYSSHDVLNKTGLLSKEIPGFVSRAPQLEMANAIEKAIAVNAQIIIEAGTGTGKTFAYLIPVFLSEKKAIISTGTKNLQDQLFLKDIPIIQKILPSPRNIVLLKGRSNYLCLYRLERSQQDGRFSSKILVSQLQTIRKWASSTQTGDVSELAAVPEDSAIWPYATSTTDNCLNQECEFYSKCYVVKARQQALAADIVVVNHHLFFADMVLQEEKFGELLPGAEIMVFDEAHHLPEIASHFFSTAFTSRQLVELVKDTESEGLQAAKDTNALFETLSRLQIAIQQMRNAFGIELRKSAWPNPLPTNLQNAIYEIKDSLKYLEDILKLISVRSKELENCWRRTLKLVEEFNLLTGETPEDNIHWFETHMQSFSLQLTPMVVANYFKDFISQQKNKCWVFTSATLTVKDNFRVFIDAMGLDNALQLLLKSPFDYQHQALLYVPRGLPDPYQPHFTEKMIEAIIPVLESTQGKAFVLFTSYKALDLAANLLKDSISFPILLQGSMPKRELIEQFKNLGNAVLLGTSSFWYGVDVRGDALSCVIIDKLPFAAIGDPILKARIAMLKKQGVDPFQSYQLPQAVLTLKQGAGRLIRDTEDKGILVICDPRLVGSNYGEVFLKSLPDMPRTRDLQKAIDFSSNLSERLV